VKLGSGVFEGPFSFASRFEDGKGTNPEELLGAAHAGCFSMALAKELAQEGHAPKRINTTAQVQLGKIGGSYKITSIDLYTEAEVPGIDERAFFKQAGTAMKNCLISQVLGGTGIKLQAKLMKTAR
jgi:osmotically inducible protein OsmC